MVISFSPQHSSFETNVKMVICLILCDFKRILEMVGTIVILTDLQYPVQYSSIPVHMRFMSLE